MKAREQELEREKTHLANEGRKEQQAKIREMESETRSSLPRLRIPRARSRERGAGPSRRSRSYRKKPSAASPKCAANFASSSMPR